MIRPYKKKQPEIHEGVYIDPSAQVIGDVMVGRHSSVWACAVLRGDEGSITIGEYTNIQDNAVLHADPKSPTILKDHITIAHQVVAHGCVVNNHCIIGIGAILLSGSEIGEYSIVAAGAVVLEGQKIPPRSLVVGTPARVIRTLTAEDIKRIRENASAYVHLKDDYLMKQKT